MEVDQSRIGTVVFGHPALKHRDEEEVTGYRDALRLIHERGAALPVSEETALTLHRLFRGQIWDAGPYKDKPVDIIEKLPKGDQRVRFRSVSPSETPDFTRQLAGLWADQLRERDISPLILLAAFNLDFLCIHPVRDGSCIEKAAFVVTGSRSTEAIRIMAENQAGVIIVCFWHPPPFVSLFVFLTLYKRPVSYRFKKTGRQVTKTKKAVFIGV